MNNDRAANRTVSGYIAAVGVVGIVLLLAWLAFAPRSAVDLTPAALLVGLGASSVWLPVRWYRGGGIVGFNMLGAVFVTSLLTLPIIWAPIIVGLASFLGYATKVRDTRKVVFNVGQELIWSVIAAAAVAVVGVTENPMEPRSAVAAVIASTIMVLLNGALMTELFHRLHGGPRSERIRGTLAMYGMTLVGNMIYGLVLAVTLHASHVAALLTGLLLGAISYGYRGFAFLEVERRRVDRLHALSQELVEASQAHGNLDGVPARIAALFGAAFVEVTIDDDPHGTRRHSSADMDDGDATMLSAPMELRGARIGAVSVRGRQGIEPWSAGDVTLLHSVANDLAVVIENHRLFDEIVHERSLLAAETQKLTDILDTTSDGIALIGTDDRVESWNPAMRRITGVDEAAAGARPWFSILRLRDDAGDEVVSGSPHVLSMALKGVRTEESVLWQVMRDDGEWRWVACSASPVERQEGGAVLVMRDVTAATEVTQLKDDFIATVSHELRTPMTPLKGFLGTLIRHGDSLDGPQRQMVLTSMDSQVRRLDTLLLDLLAVAELARGRFELLAVPITLATMARELVAGRSDEDGQRLVVSGDPDVVAFADPEGVRRVIHSVVDNALKHTESPVEIAIRGRGEQVAIEIIDEGPGIAQRDHDRIFERFVRLGNYLHRTQGPGLGLTIARALAQQMGGSVTVRSGLGSGAVFEIRLPALARTDAGAAGDSLPNSLTGSAKDHRDASPPPRSPRSTP